MRRRRGSPSHRRHHRLTVLTSLGTDGTDVVDVTDERSSDLVGLDDAGEHDADGEAGY